MERDCIISHGMSMFLHERLFDSSDRYFVYVCDLCGMLLLANYNTGHLECKVSCWT